MTNTFKILLTSGEFDTIMDRPSEREIEMAIDSMLMELAMRVKGELL